MTKPDTFTLADLAVPLIQAPMAGGPATPELAAAVSRTGALGFLAGGYLSAQQLATQVKRVRELLGSERVGGEADGGEADGGGPVEGARLGGEAFGVNLFVPQPEVDRRAVAAYRDELAPEAERLGVELPEADADGSDGWREKLSLLLDEPVPVVSFTFGLPQAAELAQLRSKGTYTVATVTTVEEARAAEAAGVQALCVQGPEAGGHRGTFDPAARPGEVELAELVAQVAAASGLPRIAAGGIATAEDVVRALAGGAGGDAGGARVSGARGAAADGAKAVQVGTAFLLADEAGTSAVHRAALTDKRFSETVVTRAFSGRWARALRNGFTDRHRQAPAGYPDINGLTKLLRAASARRGDPDGVSLYAGVNFRKARAEPAAAIVARLMEEG